MKPVFPPASPELDLRGCDYAESDQLTHIDGFLVRYGSRGRVTLRAELTPAEKLRGIQQLLSNLDTATSHTPHVFFWSRGDGVGAAVAPEQDPPAMLPFPLRSDLPHETLFQLPRSFLHTAMQMIGAQAGVRSGTSQAEHLLIEVATPLGVSASLTLQQRPPAAWALLVAVTPPVPGTILLRIGPTTFAAPLSEAGMAELTVLPASELAAPDGPPLELRLVASQPER